MLDVGSCKSNLGRAAGVDISVQAGWPRNWMGWALNCKVRSQGVLF